MHAGARRLAGGEQTRDDGVGVTVLRRDDFALVVGGNTAHVVVNGGNDGNGLLGDVHAGENGGGFGNPWKTLRQELRRQVVQVQIDVILILTHASSLANLERHRSRDDVSTGEILGARRVSLHETLALRVAQNATLPARTLRDQATGAVNTGGVELHKLLILQRQARPSDHGVAVARARVRGSRAKVRPAVSTGG